MASRPNRPATRLPPASSAQKAVASQQVRQARVARQQAVANVIRNAVMGQPRQPAVPPLPETLDQMRASHRQQVVRWRDWVARSDDAALQAHCAELEMAEQEAFDRLVEVLAVVFGHQPPADGTEQTAWAADKNLAAGEITVAAEAYAFRMAERQVELALVAGLGRYLHWVAEMDATEQGR